MGKQEYSELERRIMKAEELGQKWAELYEVWHQLDETKKSVLADIQKDLDDGDSSEAKLERLARADKTYREHINNLAVAKGQELRAKVRYETAIAWYEAARTKESTERVKMKMLNDIP